MAGLKAQPLTSLQIWDKRIPRLLFGFFRDEAMNAEQSFPILSTTSMTIRLPVFAPVVWRFRRRANQEDKVFAFFAIERQREHTSIAEQPTSLAELNLVTSLGAQPAATVPTPFFENALPVAWMEHQQQTQRLPIGRYAGNNASTTRATAPSI